MESWQKESFVYKVPDTYACQLHGTYSSKTDDGYRQDSCPSCESEMRGLENAWNQNWRNWRQWLRSGIPLRYLTRSFDNWGPQPGSHVAILSAVRAYANGFEQNFDQGRGLMLLGDLGTGKTHLACAVLTAVMAKGYSGLFTTAGSLFAQIKQEYNEKARIATTSFLDQCSKSALLVIDDIGAHRGTEWEVGILHEVLDSRYNACRPTLLTSNCTEFDQFVGARVADRLHENSIRLTIKGASNRSKMSDVHYRDLAFARPPDTLTLNISRMDKMESRTIDAGERSRFGIPGTLDKAMPCDKTSSTLPGGRQELFQEARTAPGRHKELFPPKRRANTA